MRKVIYAAFVMAAILALGCAITNYPVIYDTRGADEDHVLDSFYDKAYIIPSGQVATIWPDGTDELFTEVVQDWRGDQWLYTFNNFDPSGAVSFLDQTYCDPTREGCATVTAWNPDLPETYTYGSGNPMDDVFDYVWDQSCSGARSLSLLVSYTFRIGECGSGVWADAQGLAAEFSALQATQYMGRNVFHLPMDGRNTSLQIHSHIDGATAEMPVFGRYNGYIDNELRLALPVTPNMRYQLRWLENWVANHGAANELSLVYNGLEATFDVYAMPLADAINRAR